MGARFSTRTIAALAAIAAFCAPCYAQIAQPEPLESMLPERWHAPLSRFLRDFGASDIEEIVASAKGRLIGLREDTALVRLEHKSACFQDLCLTIVGEGKNQNLEVHAMFLAGKWITHGDVFPNMLGTGISAPVLFFTSMDPLTATHGVGLFETQRGWIVSTTR